MWVIHSETFSCPSGFFTVGFEKKGSFSFKCDENHLSHTCVHWRSIYAFRMDTQWLPWLLRKSIWRREPGPWDSQITPPNVTKQMNPDHFEACQSFSFAGIFSLVPGLLGALLWRGGSWCGLKGGGEDPDQSSCFRACHLSSVWFAVLMNLEDGFLSPASIHPTRVLLWISRCWP